MPDYLETLKQWASKWMERFGLSSEKIVALTSDWENLFQKALELVQKIAPDMMGSAANVATGIVNVLVSLGVGLVFSHILLPKKKISA